MDDIDFDVSSKKKVRKFLYFDSLSSVMAMLEILFNSSCSVTLKQV